MSNDYYAESAYQLINIEDFKDIITQLWIRIRNDRNIHWNKKAEEFLNILGQEYQSKNYKNLILVI